MTERDFWERKVRPHLERPPKWITQKVQDAMNKGLADVLYCLDGKAGKLETKYVPTWPARETTPVPIALSREQRADLRRWHRAGGAAYVLLGVAQDWYLFHWDAPEKATRAELESRSLLHGTFNELQSLAEYLSQ